MEAQETKPQPIPIELKILLGVIIGGIVPVALRLVGII